METGSIRLVKGVRRAIILLFSCLTVILLCLGWWMHFTYPKIAEQARKEELTFWTLADTLSLEDRSALINEIVETGTTPHLLPWWEHDRSMCSAVVVKLVNLFTGVKLVHTSAWTLRQTRTCSLCVGNERKLTTIWDAMDSFDADGNLTPEEITELASQVQHLDLDPNKVYVMGLLWAHTHYWEQLIQDHADINSHVALVVRGHVLHFIDTGDGEDPHKMETLAQLFAPGELWPVWIAEVHEKSSASRANGWKLSMQDLRLPETNRRLSFTQHVWPWKSLRRFLVFPSRPWYAPDAWHTFFQRADTLVEKSLLFRFRNAYDPYPTQFQEVTP